MATERYYDKNWRLRQRRKPQQDPAHPHLFQSTAEEARAECAKLKELIAAPSEPKPTK